MTSSQNPGNAPQSNTPSNPDIGVTNDPKPTTHILLADNKEVDVADLDLEKNPLPDRMFREAWRLGDKNVVEVDMTKAVEVAKARIRAEREPLLKELDVATMKALGAGKPPTDVEAKKTRLRDATADQRLAKAKTPETLKGVVEGIIAEMKKTAGV